MLFRVLEYTLAPTLRLIYRPQIDGAENVPRSGAVILAGNHISFADEIFTPLASHRQVCYFAKAEYFNTRGLRGRVMGAAFRDLGQLPVERDDPRAAAASIQLGVDVLGEGRALGIFPEGTRSPDGRLYRFRTGVARLALRSGAAVIPVGLVGTREVNPPGSNRWHRGAVAVRFGDPLIFDQGPQAERSAKLLREITEQVRTAVQSLSGQEYVDSYARSGAAQ